MKQLVIITLTLTLTACGGYTCTERYPPQQWTSTWKYKDGRTGSETGYSFPDCKTWEWK